MTGWCWNMFTAEHDTTRRRATYQTTDSENNILFKMVKSIKFECTRIYSSPPADIVWLVTPVLLQIKMSAAVKKLHLAADGKCFPCLFLFLSLQHHKPFSVFIRQLRHNQYKKIWFLFYYDVVKKKQKNNWTAKIWFNKTCKNLFH